jgi:hypothetical protein
MAAITAAAATLAATAVAATAVAATAEMETTPACLLDLRIIARVPLGVN